MAGSKVDHPLLRVQLAVAVGLAVVGIIICSVAGYLAAEVSKYSDPRYATYWMGIASVVVLLLLAFVQYMIWHKQPRAKIAYIVWIIIMAAGVVFAIISTAVLADQANTINKANKEDCMYVDKTGTYHSTHGQTVCEAQCRRGLQAKTGDEAPPRTCCCCKNPSMESGYKLVYVKKVSSCDVMFGTVYDCLAALSFLHALLACLYIALTVLGVITLRGFCGYTSVFESSMATVNSCDNRFTMATVITQVIYELHCFQDQLHPQSLYIVYQKQPSKEHCYNPYR